jgi:hypothetical protein
MQSSRARPGEFGLEPVTAVPGTPADRRDWRLPERLTAIAERAADATKHRPRGAPLEVRDLDERRAELREQALALERAELERLRGRPAGAMRRGPSSPVLEVR